MSKYFTLKERYNLELYYNEMHLKPREIACKMGKHINTIYNELHRGMVEQIDSEYRIYKKYCADTAQEKYEYNATAKGAKIKLSNDFAFANAVEDFIVNQKYSPYAALEKCRQIGFQTHICLRTLYSYIYKNIFTFTHKSLPFGKRKKSKEHVAKKPYNAKNQSIEERADIHLREDFGHWEMDTVVGKQGTKNVLLVLSERKTRQEIIKRMPDKTCNSTWKCISNLRAKLGDKFYDVFKTITVDNGCEFSMNSDILESDTELEKFVRLNLFYCHPYCSCERGTNENQNKLIRRFIPKGADISSYTDEQIAKIQDWINNYPRKLFKGLSSNEYLEMVGI